MRKTTLKLIKSAMLIGFLMFQSIHSNAQVPGIIRCYTDEMDSIMHAEHPASETRDQFEAWVSEAIEIAKTNKVIGGVYQIPVIVHVVHNGEAVGTASNVSYAAIQSQIDVLNEDFRRIFGTNGYNTDPNGADTQIEFCLAQRRPDGSAFPSEPGVNRINRNTVGFTAPPYSQAYMNSTIKTYTYNGGVATATRGWVPTKYMNIWLAQMGSGLLGYAQFPTSPLGGMFDCASGGANATDGVVFTYTSIGKSAVTGFGGQYNEGRTATHEIGHWLGLRHIWGDGGCTVDDYCNDTPLAGAANYGCPVINSCTNAPDPGNDMVANYMDYTDDLCMNIFTNDQKQRMRAVLEGSPNRVSLINSDACTPPNPSDASITDVFTPKGDNCAGSIIPSVQLRNRGGNNLTSATIAYAIDNGTVTTFSWTGTITPGNSATVALPAFTGTLGSHTFKSWSTLPNGVVDPFTVYDTSAITFMVSNGIMPNYTQNFESETFPPDLRWVVENVNADCRQWTAASGVSAAGVFVNNMAMMPCFNNPSNSNENLYTPIFILPCNATAASLTFNVAYRQLAAGTNDRLIVEISQDCGATWTATTYDKQGATLAVSGTLATAEYYPTAANHWRNETINLLSYVTGTSKNIRFRFRVIANNGNNIFVDDVVYTATTPGEIQLNQATTDVLDGGYYNFPNVSVGGTTTQTFTITNTGTTNLTLTGPIAVTGTGFALGTTFGTTTVAAGATTTFTLTFSPTAGGNFTGNVSFGTNDCDEGTYNFQINGVATVTPPVAEFSATPLVICQGGTVTFTNLSTDATGYSWNFGTGATPATASTAGPHTVTYSTGGTQTVTLTVTNAFGSDTETKTAYINVLGVGTLPLSEGFTATGFPYAGWTKLNSNNSANTWVRSATVGAPTGGNSMIFDNYNYADTDDDEFRVIPVNLTGFSASQMTFDVAYAPYNATYFDGLQVLVSTDCGATFTSVYSKSNTTLATAPATTASFVPSGAAQWRNETVNLTPYVGNGSVIVAFRNLAGNGNNLYVDNINITGTTTATANFTATPNPVCLGSAVTFTSTSTGATSYAWNFGTGATPATATTAGPHSVTYSTTGTKNVSLQINGTGPTSNQTVTVNSLNTIAAGINRTTCINSAMTAITLATTGATGATFTGLPAGVTGSWAANTVTISGTPTVSGTFNYTVTTTGGCPGTTATGTINVTPANTIAAGINSTTCINSAITTITLATTGATGATFAGLPAGVTGSWAGNVVTISGTPTASGTFNYTVTTTGGCPPATATGTITVTPANTIAAGINRTTCINSAITTITLATTGATGATFAGLPAGVTGSWAGNVVTISGTPTASGTFNYTVTTTGGCPPATATGTITVTPANTIAAGINRTTCINSAMTAITLATTGATGATFTGLPAGVTGSWAANTVTISGTPTVSGTFNYTVTTTGGCPGTTATGTINVTPANTIAAGINRTTCINSAITTISLATTGATGATFTGLPAGVTGSWAANTVTISGTPTVSGTFNYTVTTTGGCPGTTATGTITVTPANTIAAGINRTTCINSAITTISLATTGATGATFAGLPAGVTGSWAGNVVTISGTPTASGTFNYTVTTTGGCPPATATGTITVTPANTIAAGINRTTCINNAITTISLATTGATGATFAGLPAGVTGSWAGNVVTISGTPTVSGTFNYTVTTTGGCPPATATGTITVILSNSNSLTSAVGTNTQSVCVNSPITNITYSTSGATGATFTGLPAGVAGSWAGNVITISGTPTVAGTFSYTATLTGGCGSSTATGSITVNAAPAMPAITPSGATTFCSGGSVTLSTPTSTSYLWSPGGATTQTLTATASGSYTVTVSNASGCTSTSAPTAVTVNANPVTPVITPSGATTFCSGGSVTLSTPTSTSYLWSPGGATTQTLIATASGSYTVTVSNASGCTATSAPTAVTVNANPATPVITPSGATTFCSGGSVDLSAPTSTSYSWSPGGETTQTLNVTSSGSYTVTVSNASGCTSTSAPTAVTVNANPATPVITTSGATTFCSGGSVDLSAPTSNSYSWLPGGETTQTLNVTSSGSYTVTVSNASGCTSTSAPTAVTVNALPSTPVITPSGATTFCSGGSVDLSAPTSTSYSWSPGGETTQTLNVTSSGSYTVTVSNASGCTATSAPTTVTVNALPSTPVITPSGATTFCSGGSVDLSAPTSNSYSWSPGGETTQTLNVTSSGSYTVTVSNASGCTSTSAPTGVTVNALPLTPVVTPSGATTFCSGGSVDLLAPTSTSYLWSPGGETTQTLTATASGSYSVMISDANGCSATSATTSVMVNPIPATPVITPSGPTTFCEESSVNLTSSSATGNTWSSTETAQTINVSTGGTITLTVTVNGCASAVASQLITVNPSPTVSLGSFADMCDYNGAITLSGGLPAGGSYSGNGVNAGGFDPATAGLGISVITYSFTDGNGCSNTATSNILVDDCLGVMESDIVLQLYPNPSSGIIQITGNTAIQKVEVYDKIGKLVKVETVNNNSTVEFDLSPFATGVYTIRVNTNQGVAVESIVLQR